MKGHNYGFDEAQQLQLGESAIEKWPNLENINTRSIF